MATNRDRLAAVLAYQAQKRQRLADYVPDIDRREPVTPSNAGLGTNLENLSSGLGQGIVNQLEGVKSLVTDPVGSAKAAYEGVKGIVRDPAMLAEALRQTGQKAMSGPLGAGEVIGEFLTPGFKGARKPPMAEIKAYHGTADDFDVFDPGMGGRATGAESGKQATWFTDDPRVAKGYAVYAAENAPVRRKLQEADRLERIAQRTNRSEDWDKHYAAIEEAEKLEAGAYDRRKTKAQLMEVDIPDETNLFVVDAKGKTPQELSSQGDIDSWLKTQLMMARKKGKQGVQIKNLDDAAGLADAPATHYAVFDPSGVKVLSKKKLIE